MAYAQTDPRWSGELLGVGPDTIGADGCYLTTDADIATWAGYPITPAELNALYLANGVYVDGELLAGSALAEAFPDKFELLSEHYCEEGGCDPAWLDTSPDRQYVFVQVVNPALGIATHFMPIIDGNPAEPMIADSWDGDVKPLGNYGGVAKVRYVGRVLALPAQPIAPTPLPPAPPKPQLHTRRTEPMQFTFLAAEATLDDPYVVSSPWAGPGRVTNWNLTMQRAAGDAHLRVYSWHVDGSPIGAKDVTVSGNVPNERGPVPAVGDASDLGVSETGTPFTFGVVVVDAPAGAEFTLVLHDEGSTAGAGSASSALPAIPALPSITRNEVVSAVAIGATVAGPYVHAFALSPGQQADVVAAILAAYLVAQALRALAVAVESALPAILKAAGDLQANASK